MLKKTLIAFYILSVLFGVNYVHSALKTDIVPTGEEEKKKAVEIHPAGVSLKVYTQDKPEEEYKINMHNVDTVLDLFERLRNKQGFYYEKIAYIYGTEIDYVSEIKAPDGFSWRVFNKGEDITFKIHELNLEDGEIYEVKLIKT